MNDVEPSKMKVAELKEELKKRGLETSGKKGELVSRLEKALEDDGESKSTYLYHNFYRNYFYSLSNPSITTVGDNQATVCMFCFSL